MENYIISSGTNQRLSTISTTLPLSRPPVNYNQLRAGMYDTLKLKSIHSIVDFFPGFLIAVAFSSALGGLATLVGTGPNIFVKGFTDA